ncbi:RagB/SusD family nutrient uptake outer membrane protein [Chitinophaga sp. MM2321]|uniref:RagB/SusD family nutrient uptake outer membrane protein n=1 Tax=Chitinophaga sp. MM2321 TaxID=3137178 RepID=UPI0032D57041
MKNRIFPNAVFLSVTTWLIISGCTKILDKQPVTDLITNTGATSISALDAENSLAGVYDAETGYAYGLEFNVLDRITNGDAKADNCYAGGDNPNNISIDLFTFNAANDNIGRDWKDAFGIVATANITLAQVAACTDPALTPTRKNQILGEVRFMRAYTYFDLVRLFGRVPIMLEPVDQTNSEALIASTLIPQSSVDSVYEAILADLWFARANVQADNTPPNKMVITKGAVNSILAKVYASMPTPNWDSVAYYCDQVIPNYSLVPNFNSLWDNSAKNNKEAIWEFNYVGYSKVGNWIPSQFLTGGWKKFNTPTNDLVNVYRAEGDSVRLKASITFVDYGWSDAYWKDPLHYPVLSKYPDPNDGTNDFYAIRLADILLLRAEAYNSKADIGNAAMMVNKVRARVGLPATTAANANDMALAIEKERRLELAFEGHRWFDLQRTGRALTVMNAFTNGAGQNLNYHVQDYQIIYPVPQNQLDNNLLLTQNPGY